MLHFLMLPANAVCDRVGLINEHERGMMRMLVNVRRPAAADRARHRPSLARRTEWARRGAA